MMEGYGLTRFAALLASTLLITACGGGSGGSSDSDGGGGGDSGTTYDGATKAAQIDDSQKAEDMARASGEGARQAKTQEEAPTASTTSGAELDDSNLREQLTTLTRELIDQVDSSDSVSGVTTTVDDECSQSSGNAEFEVDSFTADGFESGTITYNDYCTSTISDGTTTNGPVDFSYEYDSGGKLSKAKFNYNGVEIRDDATGATTTVNVKSTCYYTDGNLDYCKFSEAFVGTNGVTYKVENARLMESSGSYNYDGKIFHPDYGYVQVNTTTNLTYGCPSSGFPDSGTIEFSGDKGNSVVVSFLADCSGFTVSYNGGSTVTVKY